MSNKPSLGHNPLAYSLKSHASFDFIRNTQEEQKDSKEEESGSVQRKTASYYLEETIIEEIRSIAKKENTSFSAVANDFLKQALKKKEDVE